MSDRLCHICIARHAEAPFNGGKKYCLAIRGMSTTKCIQDYPEELERIKVDYPKSELDNGRD